MSGALDKKATKTASKLIKKFGDIITYTEISTIYNINTGENVSTEIVHSNIPAQISKPKITDINGTLISMNDIVVNIASSDLPIMPKNNDLVTVDGVTYSVLGNLYVKGQAIIKHSLICKSS